jgi:hypothetical protein
MLLKRYNGWLYDKGQIAAVLITLLFFGSFYLGFVL